MSEAIQADRHDTAVNVSEAEAVQGDTSTPESAETLGEDVRQDSWGPTLALLAFGLAMVAQFYLSRLRSQRDAAVLFGAALMVFLVLVWRAGLADQYSEPLRALARRLWSGIETNSTRAVLVTLAFLIDLTAVRMLRTKGMEDTRWDVFALWVASIVLFLVATMRIDWSGLISRASTTSRSLVREHWLEVTLVVALTAVAFGLRFVALGNIPDIIDGDEGDLGRYALNAMRGDLRDMFGTIYGYGTMYFFILAVPLKVFGANPFGLRFASALAGSLTVPLFYLFGRRMFDQRIGFLAAAVMTVSHYHLHFSRIIPSGNAIDALFATAIFYLFYRGLEERSTNSFILSGLIFGFAQYLFVGSRLTGVVIVAFVGLLFLIRRRLVLDNLGGLFLFGLMALLVSGPMIRWAFDRTADYMARMNQTGIIQTGWLAHQAEATGQSTILILADQVRRAFLVFNYYPVTGFYNATIPVLDLVTGGVFILGLGYSLLHVLDKRYLLLNLWFWSGVVIGGALVVNTEGGAYRILVVFPAVALFIAIGLWKLIDFGTRGIEDRQQTAFMFAGAFVLVVSFFNLRYYFFEYAQQCRYGDPNTAIAAIIGTHLKGLEPAYQAYFVGPPGTNMSWAYKNLHFLSGERQLTEIQEPLESASVVADRSGPKVFFVRPQRANEMEVLRERYPDGSISELRRCGEVLVTEYLVGNR